MSDAIWVEVRIVTIVLDASVALKLVSREPGTDQAQALVLTEERIAPDWLLAEVASGLANKVRYEGVAQGRANAALAAVPRFIDRLFPTQPLLQDSMNLAVQLEHALYDCLYLVLALAEGGRVVTADRGFFISASRGGFTEKVELLTWT
jgi:predicted nucleic acid-binding protein